MRTVSPSRHEGWLLASCLAVVLSAGLAPAGIDGRPIPPASWVVWWLALGLALLVFRRAGLLLPEAMRRISWLVPVVLLFALPAALLAPPGSRLRVGFALALRALAASAVGAAWAAWLGLAGLVRGARALGAPARLGDVLEATLLSLVLVLRQVRAMLRAREARRTAIGAFADLLVAPADTVRGFGRLVAALLLRSLERAEALERARRARGIEP